MKVWKIQGHHLYFLITENLKKGKKIKIDQQKMLTGKIQISCI